jgi:hypothetical protein
MDDGPHIVKSSGDTDCVGGDSSCLKPHNLIYNNLVICSHACILYTVSRKDIIVAIDWSTLGPILPGT